MRFPGMNERCMFWQGWTLANLVPRVLLETKVPWWIVVTWFRFIAQILGNKTIYFLYFSDVPGLKLTPFNYSINMSVYYVV